MKLFVGSNSPAPDGWVSATSLEDAKQHLLNETIDELHIEDVIGTNPSDGHRLLFWLKTHIKTSYFILPNSFTLHSDDAALLQQMNGEKMRFLRLARRSNCMRMTDISGFISRIPRQHILTGFTVTSF